VTEPEDDWPQEVIPNSDILFMRVHRNFVEDGELQPNAFRDQGAGMSTNWQKYCVTAEEARRRATKNPQNNGVVRLGVGPIRNIPLTVEHTPDWALEDRSHADVIGQKTAEVRMRLLDIAEWAIKLDDDNV